MNRLMVYDYELNRNLRDVNLGDYVQSIAANQFLRVSDISSYYSRDDMSSLRNGDCTILNGWYRLKRKAHVLTEGVNALPVSVHIHNRKDIEEVEPVISSWGGKIGCRDLSTYGLLKNMGFDVYFSSCLTTTLFYEFGRLPFSERGGVVLCDVNYKSIFPLRNCLRRLRVKKICEEILSHYNEEPLLEVTHSCPVSKTHQERFELARGLLELYSKSKLVITSRIHCALPCVAMGTPVILVVENYDSRRYPGIDQFMNKIFYSESGELVVDVDMRSGVVVNNEKHIVYANRLIETCKSFVGHHSL